MGFFFSNMQIRKPEAFSAERLFALIGDCMKAKGFQATENGAEADLTVCVFSTEGPWISVCADGLEFWTEDSIRDICGPVSEALSTDVVTISCFDSDCLLLNRINRYGGIDAWAKVGRYPEIKKRTAPAKWKDLVSDPEQFTAACKEDYVFAEEALEKLEPLLGLAPEQGRFCADLLAEGLFADVKNLYFSLPGAEKPELPSLTLMMPSMMPCEMGKPSFVSAINTGGKCFGLAVAFSGSYVEQEEIRFRNVQLEYDFDKIPRPTLPLTLEKRQTQDGQWIYYAEAPGFQIPPAPKEGLPMQKALAAQTSRGFGLRFTPEGNARKRLDISVHFIPLKNPAGQCAWCVWRFFGSKRAFIEHHNQTWGRFRANAGMLLDENELDLED